ncbi:DedA family protein [Heyndrickxia acidicola]|uniref:DedA family protein n=1 Tax=Heyndrickxia acidicola TaxID=209389 RepID=A0ABU6MK35_9BACI|nr:DedA family protein [Heyndrickxia acidicola]MED1203597.1 DedA family protein [Heyndrickxia acidicola]
MHLQHLLQQYGYPGVFIAFSLEMVGFPFPGDTMLTLLGIEWKQGVFSFAPLIIASLAGNIIGSTISYTTGRFFGRSVILRLINYVGITDKKFEVADKKFNKYRVQVVLFGKFISGVRIITAYLAGINRMSFWIYSLYNAVGSLLWIVVYIVFGRYVDIFWQNYHTLFTEFLWVIIPLILIPLIIVFYRRRVKRA